MNDLLLDNDHDLVISEFDLAITDDDSRLKQKIKQELLSFKGDWFLDVEQGIPYYQEILGQRNSIEAIRSMFIEALRDIDEIADIKDLELNLDAATRILSIKLEVIDSLGSIVSLEV